LALSSPADFEALWPALLGALPRSDRACPCGSRLLYDHCHRPVVVELDWVRRLPVRDELPDAVKKRLLNAA
jgi:hypothetical protein